MEMQKDDKELEIGGTAQQSISSCLQALDRFLLEGNTVVSSIVVAEKRSSAMTTKSLVETVAHLLGEYKTLQVYFHLFRYDYFFLFVMQVWT